MIKLEGLHKTFHTKQGPVEAVSGVDVDVPAGTFFTLLGPSGCGKTTLLRMLAGLERPDHGRIAVGERTLFSSSEHVDVPAHRRQISMVFQSYAIWPHMTVFANVAYPLQVKKVPRKEVRERVERTLELVGLGGMGQRQSTRLSGGQQQRVALARALVAEPEVLLLDEPLSNLDAKLRSQMRAELKDLQRRIGVTTIYVTHDQLEALTMSDELIIMSAGVVAQRGTPQEIYRQPRNKFTAEFIGRTNLLLGTSAKPAREGLNTLVTPLGELDVHVSEPVDPARRSFIVSIRPEDLRMSEATVDGPGPRVSRNTFRGRVETVTFRGDSVDCWVRVGDLELRVRGTATQLLPVGAPVTLQVDAALCVVLVDELADASKVPSS